MTDDSGNTATANQVVTATGPVPNQAPTASFTANPNSGTVPLSVAFDGSGSGDSDGTIDFYDWDFGDGAAATGESVNHSYDTSAVYAVSLTVTDNEGATDTATSAIAAGVPVPVIDIRIAAGDDDAEERQSGSLYLDSSDLELVDDGSNTGQTIGMRFIGVNIPHGATIVDAYVQFQADENDSEPTSLEIRGQVSDDAPAFSSASGDISTREMTVTYVAWSPPPWTSVGAAGADERTPDLSEMIQEIIDQVEWSPGNALAITITGSGKRTAESYDSSPSGAALLHIEYIPPPAE